MLRSVTSRADEMENEQAEFTGVSSRSQVQYYICYPL